MQKIKYILPLLFLSSFYLQAATPAAGNTATTDKTAATEPAVTETIAQRQIAGALQDDIAFERQKRQLSNELALEKLRAELQKVRGGSAPAVMPAAEPQSASASEPESAPIMAHSNSKPVVVLVSQVAGVFRVGVAVDGQLRFYNRHETFNVNGKKYRLVSAKNNQLVAKEVE